MRLGEMRLGEMLRHRRRHGYYQLPLNLTTENPSILSPNSNFRQYFIYFIVRKVNLKLFLSWNTSTSLSSMDFLSIYVQSGRVSYLALSSPRIRRFCR